MIYYLFDFLQQLQTLAGEAGLVIVSYKSIFITMAASSLGLTLALFILKGIGLYTIGKRENVANSIFAFIPILSIFYMGKIIGKVRLFGSKIGNLGLLVMIFYILQLATSCTFDVLYCGNALVTLLKDDVLLTFDNFAYNDYTLFGNINLIQLVNVVNNIFSIIYLILDVFMIFAFFRYYGGKRGMLYSFLSVIIEPLFFIFLFVVRKQERFDLNQYMKMNFNSYNASGSSGGFNNPRNPYSSQSSDSSYSQTSDPFSEYGSSDSTSFSGDVFTDYPEGDTTSRVFNTEGDTTSDEDLF